MEPREGARGPRFDDSSRGDEDELSWLQDEKPSAHRVVLPKSEGRGPWWSRLIGQDTEARPASKKSAPQKGLAVGKVRPFDGPCDAETVVANRDELLRAVREYMGVLDAGDDDVSPKDSGSSRGSDILDILAARRAAATPRAHVEPFDDDVDMGQRPKESPDAGGAQAPETGAATRRMRAPGPGEAQVTGRINGSQSGEVARRTNAPQAGEVTRRIKGPQAGEDTRRIKGSQAGEDTRRTRGTPTPSGPSAMSRQRLVSSEKPRPREKDSDPSISSFGVSDDDREATPYPQHFISEGLRFLMVGQWGAALDFYSEVAKRRPLEADGWYGEAGALLGMGCVEEASSMLLRGYEIDPLFPFARLVTDTCREDPVAWYDLAAALVALRRRAAYMCAEVILTECLGGATDVKLRGRAQRVQRDIARMLQQRARRDEFRILTRPEPWYHYLRHPAVAVAIIILVVALWGTRYLRSTPGTPAPSPAIQQTTSASPLPSTAPRRASAPR